jgi:hypothetical protein
VRRANDGALAIQESSLAAAIKGQWKKLDRLILAAVEGQCALVSALEKDPDTPYRAPGEQAASSMRQTTLILIDTLTPSSSCDENTARALLRAINGLPR